MHKRFLFLTFLPTLVSYLFDDSHWDRYEMVSYSGFEFTFSWWLVMLSIFSCAHWPSMQLFWKTHLSRSLPGFKSGFYFFLILSLLSSLYILDINLWLNVTPARALSHAQLFATPWTVAPQAPLSIEFSRQEYWSGLPFPPLGYFFNLSIESVSPESLALAGGFFTTAPPGNAPYWIYHL